ncbi:hypothetical protein KC480_05700 [Bacillus velezensis]|uniref:hypothetical protein n=1 Tax=Bacillus velezensis TaxID=492670 RepID=UPI001E4F3F7C|nr:hypothetical protein [Bacillus velezensis]MCD7911018.1 hypothetical protein [Bacillus velezensis]
MNITDIFKSEHFALNENELIPIDAVKKEEEYAPFCDILNINSKYLFFNPEGFINPFCYWDGLYYHPFMALDTSFLIMGNYSLAEGFKIRLYNVQKAYDAGNWNLVLKYADKKVLFQVYKKVSSMIPLENRANTFLEIYVRSESGHASDFVRSVLEGPKDESYNISNAEPAPSNGYYVIYRGSTPESTPVERAFSWTLSKEIAQFFAERFDSDGVVYQGKIHADKVKAYINNEEQEVIVFPEDIIDVKLI